MCARTMKRHQQQSNASSGRRRPCSMEVHQRHALKAAAKSGGHQHPPQYHPSAPNHRKTLVFTDHHKKEPPNSRVPKVVETGQPIRLCAHRVRKEIILRSNSPWGFYPFQPPDSPKGQVARVSGELPPCMTRGSPLRPLGCLT